MLTLSITKMKKHNKNGIILILLCLTGSLLWAQNAESLEQKFADKMCTCMSNKLEGKATSKSSLELYFNYCKGFVSITLSDEIAAAQKVKGDVNESLAQAVVAKLMSNCPIVFPLFIGEDFNKKVRDQCKENIVPLLQAEEYSDEICSCFSDTYVTHLGTDSLMIKMIKSGETIRIEPENPVVVLVITDCINNIANEDIIKATDAHRITCNLLKMRFKGHDEMKGLDMDAVCDCIFTKQYDYMFEHLDTPVDEWPSDLEDQFFKACLKTQKEKKNLKKI